MDVRINHIAMYVHDLELMRDFYTQWFGAVSNDGYKNMRTGLRTYFLEFGNGTRLEIMNKPGISELDADLREEYFGYVHLAFQVGGRGRVDSLTEELKKAGYTVLSGPRTTGDGYYESCVLDPEGNRIEITG